MGREGSEGSMNQPGDVNQDGKITSEDLEMLRRLLESTPELLSHLPEADRKLLDVNQDGEINYNDLMRLCTQLVEQAQETPVASKLDQLRQKLR